VLAGGLGIERAGAVHQELVVLVQRDVDGVGELRPRALHGGADGAGVPGDLGDPVLLEVVDAAAHDGL
jgi:hypothetical protein